MNIKSRSVQKAFTLIELLIVIAIIGILVVAFLPNIMGAPAKARDAVRAKTVQDIQTAVELYISRQGFPLPSIDSHCIDSAIATAWGINVPVDPSNLETCAAAADSNKYFYFYNSTVTEKYYVIAAKVEKGSSANNSSSATSSFTTAPNLTAAKALISSSPLSDAGDGRGTYRIAVGPL